MSDTYQFRCPACGAERTAPRSIVGRRVRCQECNAMVTAPPESSERERQLAETWEHEDQPGTSSESKAPRVPTAPPSASTDDFDPYYKWLAIPKAEQPPNHYRLLGVPLFEGDFDVIAISADRQMAHVKAQATGRHAALSQKLLNELANASACLLEPAKKKQYDAQLKRELSEARKQMKLRSGGKGASPAQRPVGSATVSDIAPVPTSQTADAAELKKPDEDPASPQREQAKQPEMRSDVAADERPSPPLPVVPSEGSAVVEAPPVESVTAPPVELVPLDESVPQEGAPAERGLSEDEFAEDGAPDEARVVLRRGRRAQEAEMDMTPMVDVTFLLLIFFMVTAAFALQRSKELPTPEEDSPSAAQSIEDFEEDPNVVIVRVDSYNTFHVVAADWEQEAPSEQELLIKLRDAREGSGGETATQLLVIANGEASYERVVMALDAGAAVGMDSIKLTTVEEDDE